MFKKTVKAKPYNDSTVAEQKQFGVVLELVVLEWLTDSEYTCHSDIDVVQTQLIFKAELKIITGPPNGPVLFSLLASFVVCCRL